MSEAKVIIPPSMRRKFKVLLDLAVSELLADSELELVGETELDIPFSEPPMDPEDEIDAYDDDWGDEDDE